MRTARTPRQPEGAPVDDPAGLIDLGPVAELAVSRRRVVTVGVHELLVLYGRGRFTVVENRCPHRGYRLDGARVGWRTLTCPLHSFRYSLVDGHSIAGPSCRTGAGGRLTLFGTRAVNGRLYAVVPAAEAGGR